MREVLFGILSLIGLVTVFQNANYVTLLILDVLSPWWGRLLLTFIAFVAAIALFYVREANRLRYALMELAFGVVSTWYSISALTIGPGKWPVVVAAIYLIVRGFDNLKTGHKQSMITWRSQGMNGTPEEREEFLRSVFHGVRFNGRLAILWAQAAGETEQEMCDKIYVINVQLAARQAKETDYDVEQTELYIEVHRKACESLAEDFSLNEPSSENS